MRVLRDEAGFDLIQTCTHLTHYLNCIDRLPNSLCHYLCINCSPQSDEIHPLNLLVVKDLTSLTVLVVS